MRSKLIILLSLLLLLSGCAQSPVKTVFTDSDGKSPVDYVDPFIGTDDMGHMFPGAAAPFGLVQLSPETDVQPYSYGRGYNPKAYEYCSGYQYHDSTIVGFAHTHFNGTGHSDLGDILLMATTGELIMDAGTSDKPESGYRSRFSHEDESARAGFYEVTLSDYDIHAELTATKRVGMHRYTFNQGGPGHLILDLTSAIYNYPGKLIWSSLRVENDSLITGYRQTRGWARAHRVYFAMALSKPVKAYGLLDLEKQPYGGFYRRFDQNHNFPERAGREIKAHFDFDMQAGEALIVKVALSPVSTANALENLKAEVPGWDFDLCRREAETAWNQELSQVAVEADTRTKKNFYTALYHTFLSPVEYTDVNGQYRGLDENTHVAKGFVNHSIFSLWDTYRALHPLFTLLKQERSNDLIQSMLVHAEQSVHGVLPVWSHHGNENWCMIGYHAVPVIADAYTKGIQEYDADAAMSAMLHSANFGIYDGIDDYRKLGWVAADKQSSAASKTLEFAYDDWTIARMAEAMGKTELARQYDEHALNYRHLYDENSGFLRARNSDGTFPAKFDPMDTHGQGYIEGNAWNYSLYVPHDVAGFIDLIGGEATLESWLDKLFVMEVSDEALAGSEDVTRVGMIGNYVHGNEPSHHVPYMYAWTGSPWKTQEKVHLIMNTMYNPAPNGLCGNDDCGQMSAWYIFSALGFYPVAPGNGEYVFGSPSVKEATVHFENGKSLHIVTDNWSEKNIYIQSIDLNGQNIERCAVRHADLMKGGTLRYVMGSEPNKSWGSAPEQRPYSLSDKK